MVMLHQTLILAAVALMGSVIAPSTVSLFFSRIEQKELATSVVADDELSPTYGVGCPSTANATICHINQYTTAEIRFRGDHITIYPKCSKTEDAATCIESIWSGDSTNTGTTTVTRHKNALHPITIIDGQDKLTAALRAMISGSSSECTPATLATTDQADSNAPTSATESATPTQNNNKASYPKQTQNAMLAGVAAIFGGALIL